MTALLLLAVWSTLLWWYADHCGYHRAERKCQEAMSIINRCRDMGEL